MVLEVAIGAVVFIALFGLALVALLAITSSDRRRH